MRSNKRDHTITITASTTIEAPTPEKRTTETRIRSPKKKSKSW